MTNPFRGDVIPSRVPLFQRGRPSRPFPTLGNYRKPIGILDAIFWAADKETGAGQHNRYITAPLLPLGLVTRDPAIIKAVLLATGDKPGQFDRDTWPTRGIARHFGFGYGSRVCPAKFLGLLEVGLVVGAFVKTFKFSAVEEKLEANAGVSTKPDDGALVRLSRR